MDGPDDVLEHGPERPRRRRLPIALAAVAVLGLVAYGAVRLGGEGPGAGSGGTDPPRAVTSPAASPTESWRTTEGACESRARLPIMRPTPRVLQQTTGLRVIAGGPKPAVIDVDSGRSTPLSGVPDGEHVDQLVRRGDKIYAVAEACYDQDDGNQSPTVLRVRDHGTDRVHFAGPVGGLIAGPSGVWGVRLSEPGHKKTILRGIDGSTLRLPRGVWFAGVMQDAIVGEIMGNPDVDRLPALALFDPDTGKVRRRIPGASPLAVTDDFVLWTQNCASPYTTASSPPCVLHRAGPGVHAGRDDTYTLPRGRVPFGRGAVSTDGRFAAFQLGKTHQDGRYNMGHPGPPSQVAVLDLSSGKLQVVPSLELAPKTLVGMAFAPDSGWLLLAVNEGRHGRLLAWRLLSNRLLRCPGKLPGPLSSAPPLLAMAR
ncbi:MAG: hypothetical protein ACRDQA_10855 [Nocardioidaceae bacterium]